MIYTRTTAPARFPSLRAPRVNRLMPSLFRAMAAAMRAVDLDIEQHGAVSYETVEQVRNTRALLSL
jgi:hypothetical protein